MEGVGSRLGRASSRYGPSATAAVFNGRVRKWKRKWVQVSPSPTLHNHRNNNSHSQSNGHLSNTITNNNNSSNNGSPRLLLCRWTPLSTTSTANSVATATGSPEEPPKRKFRYTPIAVLEEQRKAEKKLEQEARTSEMNQFGGWNASKNVDEDDDDGVDDDYSERSSDNALKKEIQDSNTSHLDLGLCLKGHNTNIDSAGQRAQSQVKKASSSGFSAID